VAARWPYARVWIALLVMWGVGACAAHRADGAPARSGSPTAGDTAAGPAGQDSLPDFALELAERLPRGADRCIVARPLRLSAEQRQLYAPLSKAEKLAWSKDVRVLLVRDADPDATVAALEHLGGVSGARFTLNDEIEVASFSLPGDRMRAAASIPGVYSVQVAPTETRMNGRSSTTDGVR